MPGLVPKHVHRQEITCDMCCEQRLTWAHELFLCEFAEEKPWVHPLNTILPRHLTDTARPAAALETCGPRLRQQGLEPLPAERLSQEPSGGAWKVRSYRFRLASCTARAMQEEGSQGSASLSVWSLRLFPANSQRKCRRLHPKTHRQRS
jgi:hypothetical protein